MPKTTPELAKDVETLQLKIGEQDVRNAKIDDALALLAKQSESFTTAIHNFQKALIDMNTAIIKLQAKTNFQWKIMTGIGAAALLIGGTFLGQFVHIFPR